jgi:hypothetical protein
MNRYKVIWHDSKGVSHEEYVIAETLAAAKVIAESEHGDSLFHVEAA